MENQNELITRLLFFYTESALHAGTGSGLSNVDLPIQRERTTQYPNVQGSGVKGALRSAFPYYSREVTEGKSIYWQDPDVEAVFGPMTDRAEEHAGAVSVGEARIVLFPVRSLAGVFAYVTCPQVIARLEREIKRSGEGLEWTVPEFGATQCLVTSSSTIIASGKVVLEEFSFTAQNDSITDTLAQWLAAEAFPQGVEYDYWRAKVQNSLVILPDDAFRDFVVNSTEVTTRVRIVPDSKTVQTGALWTQEALPADTLMVSAITARRVRLPIRNDKGQVIKDIPKEQLGKGTAAEVMSWLMKPEKLPLRLQMGGDETTGSGQVALKWY